ncbi:MAG: hypothetical protein LUP91_13185, partial [Methylococcaceae bacterium]|nr:hypothetical protein [Methylococcaceae bacterium]
MIAPRRYPVAERFRASKWRGQQEAALGMTSSGAVSANATPEREGGYTMSTWGSGEGIEECPNPTPHDGTTYYAPPR